MTSQFKLNIKLLVTVLLIALCSFKTYAQDNDGDGVLDVTDIDDDNDGILDVNEFCSLNFNFNFFPLTYLMGYKTVTQTLTGSVYAAGCDANGNVALQGSNSYIDLTFSVPTVLRLVHANNNTVNFDNGDIIEISSTNANFSLSNASSITTVANNVGFLSIKAIGANNDAQAWKITTSPVTSIRIKFIAPNSGNPNTDIRILTDCISDTDNDGIFNQMDLDSDNDGCSDAFEGGATNLQTPNFKFTGNVGANGLDNTLEALPDNGLITYTSTYNNYAIFSYLNSCLDSDGDGVANVVDKDDDNDGIIDELEDNMPTYAFYEDFNSLTCNGFVSDYVKCPGLFSGAGTLSIEPIGTALSPTLGTTESMGNILSVNASTNNNLDFYRKTFTVIPNQSYTFSFYAGKKSATSGSSKIIIKIFGSQIIGFELTETWNRYFFSFNVLSNTSITIGLSEFYAAANGDDFGVDDIKMELLNPAVIPFFNDMDKDGIKNSLDLDSDGDGCEDAVEGGGAFGVPNLVISSMNGGNTGSSFNGLSSSSITKNLGNNISGATTTIGIPLVAGIGQSVEYSQNIIYNACIDTDNDGIKDVDDMDDDNDGIIDDIESDTCSLDTSCTNYTISPTSGITSTGCLGWISTNSNFDYMRAINGKPEFDLQGTNIPMYGLMQKTYRTKNNVVYSFTVISTRTGNFVPINGVTPILRAINTLTGLVIESVNLNPTTSTTLVFRALSNSTKIEVGYTTAIQTSNAGTIYWSPSDLKRISSCGDIDTDGDGIPNRLDLDSDNDGCSDAIESGATSDTTVNFKFTGFVGLNGIDNSKETSIDNGVLNYSPTYIYAIDNNLKNCFDNDGDGINDIVDIDDDNDGVLDVLECPVLNICDTDGDGINNSFDLDSDNDGCSDAYEAGATKNTSSYFKFSGPFGNNGLDNSLETSIDNGMINYTASYSRAKDTSIMSCLVPIIAGNIGVVGNVINLCQLAGGTRQLTATTNPTNNGGSLNWYTSALGGNASSVAPSINLSLPDTISHYVSQTVNGVEGPRVEIKIIINISPSLPGTIIGPSIIAMDSMALYSVAPVANAISYIWSLPSGFIGTSTTNSITCFAGNTSGTVSVQANNNGCLSNASILNVIATVKPSKPYLIQDTVIYCQNTNANPLSAATNPINNGGVLKWYTSAIGGIGSTNAPTPSTVFASIVVYYVTQTVNGFESDRAPYTVIVNPSPNQPNSISGPSSVSPNSNYIYSIGNVSGALSYTWTIPNGWTGTSSTNSINITTDNNAAGIISVIANSNSCSSQSQSITIGTIPLQPQTSLIGDSITYCQNEIAAPLSASLNPLNSGGILNWYLSASGGNPSISAPVVSTGASGIFYYYVSQNINGVESLRKAIKVIVKPTPNQPNSIVGTTSVSVNSNYTYSVGTVVGATSYTWTLPNGWIGNSTSNSILVTTNNFPSGIISVVANNANCSSAAQTVSIGSIPNLPNVSLVGDSVAYCQNEIASPLSASLNPMNNGGVLNWYSVSIGGTASNSAPTPSTISSGIYYYYVSQTVNGVESGRKAIKVLIKPVPNQPGIINGPSAILPNTNYTYSVGLVTGATSYTWNYPPSWTGTSSSNYLFVTSDTITTYTIRVFAKIGNCSSLPAILKIGTLPNTPTTNYIGDSIDYCQGTSPIQLLANTNPPNNGGVLTWYTTPIGGVGSPISPVPPTALAGFTNYYVSQTVNGIESERKVIKVNIKPSPNQPNTITGSTSISANSNYTYSIGAVSGASSYTWTLPNGWIGNSTTNSINITTNNTPSGIITVVANNAGCSSVAQSISIGAIPDMPNSSLTGDSVDYCQYQVASALSASLNPLNNGGVLNWYSVSSGGTSSAIAPNPNTTSAGTFYYYVSQTVNGVESVRKPIKVIIKPAPNQPGLINGPSAILANSSYTYSVGLVPGATNYTWTIPSSWLGTSTSNYISVLTDTVTTYTIKVTSNIGNCSSIPAVLKIGTLPNTPTTNYVGDSIVYCQGASTLQLNAFTNPNNNNSVLNWYTVAFGGVKSSIAPTPSTSLAGISYYYVSQTVNGVESERKPIKVIVNATPNQPNPIIGSISVLGNSTYTYSITNVVGATSYSWILPLGWTGNSINNSISINTNNTTSGIISVTANLNTCSSIAQTLNIGTQPSNPNSGLIGDSVVYCQGAATTQLSAKLNPINNGGTLNWYNSPSGGVASGFPPTPSSVSAGNTYYYVSQTVNGIESGRTQIQVIVKPTPNQPNVILGNTSVLPNSNYTYSVSSVIGATSYTWTIPNGWSGSSVTNSINVTSNSLTSGTLSVTSNLNGCSSNAQQITIGTLPNNPLSGSVGDSIVYCQGSVTSSLTALLNPLNNGGVLNWYTIATGGTASTLAPTPSSALAGITYYYVSQTVNGVESGRTAIKVVVKPVPNQPNAITGNITVATYSNNTYTVGNVQGATSYTWTIPNGWTGGSTTNTIAVFAGNSGGQISVIANLNGCSSASQSLTISMQTKIPDISINANIVGNRINYCLGSIANSLVANTTESGASLIWYTTATGGTGVTNAPTPSTSSIGTTSYYVSQKVNGIESERVELKIQVVLCSAICQSNDKPLLNKNAIKNICPLLTADLNAVSINNIPVDTNIIVTWHTAIPTSEFNIVNNTNTVNAGTYYAVYYDKKNKCYAGNGNAVSSVSVSIDYCNPNCGAGNAQPYFGTDSLLNKCPLTTVDLLSLNVHNKPVGTILEWRNLSNRILPNPSQVGAGFYMAFFKDTVNNCFSTGIPNLIQVKIVVCEKNNVKNDYISVDVASTHQIEIQTAINDNIVAGSKYSIASNGLPKKGIVSIDSVSGKIIYTVLDTNYVGYDTILYQLCDSMSHQCATAYVILSLSHPSNIWIDNNTDANAPFVIEGDKIKGIPEKTVGANQNFSIATPPKAGAAIIDSYGILTYTRNLNSCGRDSMQISKTYIFNNDRPNETYYFWIYLTNICENEESFPNFISPNGDGINDNFVLPKSILTKYPDSKLTIYNRWGNIVWRSQNVYQNEWNGINNNNNPLPDGVYFFIIEFESNFKKIHSGFVQILRD